MIRYVLSIICDEKNQNHGIMLVTVLKDYETFYKFVEEEVLEHKIGDCVIVENYSFYSINVYNNDGEYISDRYEIKTINCVEL